MLKYILFISLLLTFAAKTNASNSNTSELYSSVCQVAIQKGFTAAKHYAKTQGKFISKHFNDVTCNRIPLSHFAKQPTSMNVQNIITLNKVNNTDITNLCIEAIEKGVRAVARKKSLVKGLECNGMPVAEFVQTVKGQI